MRKARLEHGLPKERVPEVDDAANTLEQADVRPVSQRLGDPDPASTAPSPTIAAMRQRSKSPRTDRR